MGINPVTFYQAVCDACGNEHEGPDGIEAWSDENGAYEMATGSGWVQTAHDLLCEECAATIEVGSQEEDEA